MAITKLAEALIAAQRQFKPALRTETNPFFKNYYVDLQGVLDCCQQALWGNGLTVTQTTRCRDGAAYLVTTLLHTSGESLEGEYPLAPTKPNDPQMLGAAMTYARRYALMAILGIAAEDDDGETAAGRGGTTTALASHSPTAATPPPWPASCPDHNKLFRRGLKGGWYCATKLADGNWCKQHPQAKPDAEPKLPQGVAEESPDDSLGF